MYEQISTLALLSALTFSNVACVGGDVSALTDNAQAQAAAAQRPNFTPVAGADLKSKLDAAVKQGRAAANRSPFWVAYTFDVRPGIAIDPDIEQFNGSINNFGGTTVFRGKVDGITVETRNLGLFLLHDPQSGSITRAEIYNLERKREYGGYPVYWLGRAGNDESLNYLSGLVEGSRTERVVETATGAWARGSRASPASRRTRRCARPRPTGSATPATSTPSSPSSSATSAKTGRAAGRPRPA